MANNINTVLIGDEFEFKSLDIIKKIIADKQLGVLADYIKIFQKKGYYSEKRRKEIIFDLSVEFWPPGASRYVMVYFFECKNHTTRVPVNKIEDFHSKILQVSGVNAKGIFITNSPLQESAFNFAESVGMMVIQGESSNSYNIILHRSNGDVQKNRLPFIKLTTNEQIIDAGVNNLEKLIDKAIRSAFTHVIDENKISYNIDRLSSNEIESIANRELDRMDPDILLHAHTIDASKLLDYLQSSYQLKFNNINESSYSLGSFNFKENTLSIHNSIKRTNRELFTVAHEFGHFLLHQKLSIGQNLYDAFDDTESNFKTGKNSLNNPRQWIEWQANHFAVSLILPKGIFLATIYKLQDTHKITRGKIYIDSFKPSTMPHFINLIAQLSQIFSVSKTTVIYRMKELNLINDHSRIKTIGQMISDYKENFYM